MSPAPRTYGPYLLAAVALSVVVVLIFDLDLVGSALVGLGFGTVAAMFVPLP